MRNMKKDMGGAAIAISLFLIANSFLKKSKIILIILLAENSVSGSSMRPGDIYTSAAGKKVEISHTDAEGRLLLADAIELANNYNPSLIIDFATLTGAARIALGEDIPAYFSNDDDVAKKIETLNQNKIVVEDRIKTSQDVIRKANADLNAISGAIQVCEQLISELPANEEQNDKQG